MQRHSITPRPDWPAQVEALGLTWHSAGGSPYWDESAYYAFSGEQVEELERATAELYRLFIEAGDAILDRGLMGDFGIPAPFHEPIRKAWFDEPRALHFGRFDLGYDGKSPPKLFEFNCDTPTSLLEAAVIQWEWKEQVFPGADQYNSLHDRLVQRWRDIGPEPGTGMLHLTHAKDPTGEDAVNVAYMADTAEAAGIPTQQIAIDDIGWDMKARCFVDLDGRYMEAIYHLYPWEWLVHEPFAEQIVASFDRTLWIEPVWKMLWNNKAILPLLWDLFPDHPNLLEASLVPMAGDHVRKPYLSREGFNVQLVADGRSVQSPDGDYGHEGYVYQRLYRVPGEGSNRPVIGSWVVDGEPAGIGIREDGWITTASARFVPHIVG